MKMAVSWVAELFILAEDVSEMLPASIFRAHRPDDAGSKYL
jgi:hypothetical protein